MSLFNKILTEFNKVGVNDKSKFSFDEINNAIDQLCRLNTDINQFDRDVAQQIWEHSTKNPEGRVLLKDYIQTIIDARNMLKDNIEKCFKQLKFQQDATKKVELQQCHQSYNQDYKILSQPFGLDHFLVKDTPLSQSHIQKSARNSENSSQIFTDSPSSRQESTSLKIVLFLTIICLFFQILCTFTRNHFLNTLSYFTIISIFALNYFDKLWMRLCLIELGTSIVLDLLWLIVHSSDYWNPAQSTPYSHMQNGFLKFVYVITVVLMLSKVFLIILMFRFTKNTESTRKYIKFLNTKICLNGKLMTPLSAILNKKTKNNNLD